MTNEERRAALKTLLPYLTETKSKGELAVIMDEEHDAVISLIREYLDQTPSWLPISETLEPKALYLLRQSYMALAFAFNQLHANSRTIDEEICAFLQKVSNEIERFFDTNSNKL